MESLAPNIFVNDLPATIEFYKKLGFVETASVPNQAGGIQWAMMSCGAVVVMFQTFDSISGQLPVISRTDGGSLLLYIKVKQIRKFFEKLKGQVTILTELEKTFYGAIEFSVLDNNNYMLTFAEDE